MIQTILPRGAHARGASNSDWVYRTPAFPDGISQIGVTNLPREEQDSLAEYWFRLNFVPFEGDMGGAGYGVSTPGLGGYGSGTMLPGAYLGDEFGDVLPLSVIDVISARLMRGATWWIPVPPDAVALHGVDPAAAARSALDLVEGDLLRRGLGHNQGPPLNPSTVDSALEQVRLGREAVASGYSGIDAARSAAVGLVALVGLMGVEFAKGVAKKAGEDAEPYIKHGLAVLLDHMLQAVSALLHWIASFPPGPLL